MAALDVDIASRHRVLASGKNFGIASDAATCAIRLKDFGKAVEFLEAGRSIFWQQALKLRTLLAELRLARPKLGRKASEILGKLERGSHRDLSSLPTLPADSVEHISQDAESLRLRNLNGEWLKVLDDIRAIPQFRNFLRPKSLDALRAAAVRGPVVILNVNMSTEGSASFAHALIVTSSANVQCVPLPGVNVIWAACLAGLVHQRLPHLASFDPNILKIIKSELRSTLQTRLIGQRVPEDGDISPNEAFGLILAELWALIVKPVLSALKLEVSLPTLLSITILNYLFQKSANPSKLWWCPTGPLIFLPIHAAGIYSGTDTDYISQYVVSSYSPTLTALLDRPAKTLPPLKMTAMMESTPTNPNLFALADAPAELTAIKTRVPKQWLTTVGDSDSATVQRALDRLRTSTIIHFACHGIQHPQNPLDSGLELADGRVKVSDIMRETQSLKGMSLAYLAACETGKGDKDIPDESMHLAATLLFAGYSGVVATMW
jgi:hypothetical protein